MEPSATDDPIPFDELLERIKALWPPLSRAHVETQTVEKATENWTVVTVQKAFLALHETSRAALEECRVNDILFLQSVKEEMELISYRSAVVLQLVRDEEAMVRSTMLERESEIREFLEDLEESEHAIRSDKVEVRELLERRRALEKEMHVFRHKS
jgi:hypothetical protein